MSDWLKGCLLVVLVKEVGMYKTANFRFVATGFLVAMCGAAPAVAESLPQLDCVIAPHLISDVSSQVDGVIDSISVERGDLVQAGQKLVVLDSRVEMATLAYAKRRADATAEVSANRASAEFNSRRHLRIKSLYQDKVTSLDQVDEAGTQARLAKLELQRANENIQLAQLDYKRTQENLAQRTIISPFDGVVVERFLSIGESVEDTPVLRIAQIDPLRVDVIVPVAYMRDIEVGQQATIYPEAPVSDAYSATVTIVDQVADAASGTFRVRLTLPNPDLAVPAGLRCGVKFNERGSGSGVVAKNDLASDPQ
jgi:RND family efflux transporter MFP subunit